MVRAYIALGGNVGDVEQSFRTSLAALRAHEHVKVLKESAIYRTPPWGKTDQPDFLNMAVEIETDLSAHDLLDLCLTIERASGRVREERWGPRTIDLDIIAYDDQVIADERLTVPHPHAHERAFVLAPLNDIASDLMIAGKNVRDWLKSADASGMTRI
jgi:2-amino-4-hydroxy-6-hydroxymethyldihydropteridine diphosphokinase